jgi:hypothetical protein
MKEITIRKVVSVDGISFGGYVDWPSGASDFLSQKDHDRVLQAIGEARKELAPKLEEAISSARSPVAANVTCTVDAGISLATITVRAKLNAVSAEMPQLATGYALCTHVGQVHGSEVFSKPEKITFDVKEALAWVEKDPDNNKMYAFGVNLPKAPKVKWIRQTWSPEWNAGYRAAQAGTNIKRNDSPYLEGSQADCNWRAGWDQGDRDDTWARRGARSFLDGESMNSGTPNERDTRYFNYGYRMQSADFGKHILFNHVFVLWPS